MSAEAPAATALHPFDAGVVLTPLNAAAEGGVATGREGGGTLDGRPADAPGHAASGAAVRYAGATHPAWANMVGPFGGITAATLLHAVVRHPQRLGEPLALTVNYAGPVADGPFEVEAAPVRTNRSTQHWWVRLLQQGMVAATATAVTAVRRSGFSEGELPAPSAPPPEAVPLLTKRPPLTWLSNVEMRVVHGEIDFGVPSADAPAGNGAVPEAPPRAEASTLMWLRDHPPRPLDALALASLADAFFPRVFLRRGRFVPAGTVSLTTYFHADAAALAAVGSAHLLGQASGRRYHGGFFEQDATLWSATGELLASSHQVVYFKG